MLASITWCAGLVCWHAYASWGNRLGSLTLALALTLYVAQRVYLKGLVVVDVFEFRGRVALQTAKHRHLAAPGEVELLQSFGRFSRICLKKSPYWLPNRLWTAHSSAAAAVADRAALTQIRSAPP